MAVLDRAVTGNLALRAAGDDHRNLHLEIDEPFKDGGRVFHLLPDLVKVAAAGYLDLTLAVIAEPPGLQDGGQFDLLDRLDQRVDGFDIGKDRRADAEIVDKAFLEQPVLRDLQHLRIGAHGHQRVQEFQRVGRDILELQCHHIDAFGEFLKRRLVAIGRNGGAVADLGGGAVLLRAKDMDEIAHFRGRNGHHPAKLAIAENSDMPAGRDYCHFRMPYCGSVATLSVCCARQSLMALA